MEILKILFGNIRFSSKDVRDKGQQMSSTDAIPPSLEELSEEAQKYYGAKPLSSSDYHPGQSPYTTRALENKLPPGDITPKNVSHPDTPPKRIPA